ncbi:MAG: hypothetical protein AAGK04_00165 [Planctomycetota bacterium]
MAYNHTTPSRPSKGATMRRVGVYLMGVAIGLVALGMFNAAKHRARQSQPNQPQPQAASPTNPAGSESTATGGDPAAP